jgi:hypothetical protein
LASARAAHHVRMAHVFCDGFRVRGPGTIDVHSDQPRGQVIGVEPGAGMPKSAWFKKCHFRVAPEIDRALIVKVFLVLGVTLI